MARMVWSRLVMAGALTVGMLPVGTAVSSAEPETGQAICRDATVAGDVEQQRLTRTLGQNPVSVPRQLLVASGMIDLVSQFDRRLCTVRSATEARTFVTEQGERLWRTAVRAAQQPSNRSARLPGADDRPLYWARVNMTLALRQWIAPFRMSTKERTRLVETFERASRGITDARFTGGKDVGKLFVSGFDPFVLDQEIRRGNPSGAIAIALDGRRLTAAGRTFEVQTVLFPVRYGDFDRGMVEDAFTPHLGGGTQRADMITTISQGRPDVFDLEIFNGRRRATTAGDNLNLPGGGTPTKPVVAPGVAPGPEFIPTSLPTKAMLRASGQPYLVQENTEVTEIPAGATAPVTRPNGPTGGSIAVNGSGGSYLSNEVAYRTSLLRTILAPGLPGGHVHTPVLNFAENNRAAITDPVFERGRADMTQQVLRILRAGLGTLR